MDFLTHLSSWLSPKEIDELNQALLEKESKHALLLNTNKMSEETFLKLYPNVIPHPIVKHAFIYDKNEYDFGKYIYHDLGSYYLQEPSAMSVAFLLGFENGEKVLDMCAAPGGKTIQASLLLNDTGFVISNDISKNRAGAILENIERLGIGNVIITNNDFSLIENQYNNYFDKIILDAPCSGSGMFRKQSEMKEDWSIQKVLKYAEIQKNLIKTCYKMLKPGGKMSYSTCSFSLEENEEVVESLLNFTDVKTINLENLNLFQYDKKPLGYHFLPNKFPGEGQYICIIQKPGNHEISKDVLNKLNESKFYGIPKEFIHQFGDTYFMLKSKEKFKKLNIIREGVKLGEINKNILKYDHHYASYIKSFPNELELTLQDALKYFEGNSLNIPFKKGFFLLKYNGLNIDIAKSDGNVIKNKFPKYLRKK